MDYLPENVYDLVQRPPTHGDADPSGRVLYFHPKFGWYSASYMYSLHTGTTHWTYCPVSPPVDEESPRARRAKAFEDWMTSLDVEIDDTAKAWAQLAFNAAWHKLQPIG